ncbi:SDR family oxidoreductase [Paracoccaceae bacterium]
MSFSIDGKTAIVTGAANGLGLAIARHFLDRGARVMFADQDEDKLEAEIGDEVRGEGAVRMFAGDLREKLAITNLLSATIDAFDRVDILVNASRVMKRSDPLKLGEDCVEDLLQQNLMTALRLSQMTAKRMIQQAERDDDSSAPAGAIINLSSITAQRTLTSLMGYSISCAAVEQMTRAMALTLAPKRIRVNAVSIGSVMSASLQHALREEPDWRPAIEAATPMGRIAPATEIVETVQYLASDAAAFVTGQVLVVDGGRSLLDAVAAPAH